MRLIIQEYGTSLLAVLTASMIFFLCLSGIENSKGERGIYRILSESMGQKELEYANDIDREKFKTYIARGNPVISCHATGIYVGERVDWQSVFHAVDVDEHILTTQIISIDGDRNISGDYCFVQSGIYVVEVLAVDSSQKQTRNLFQLPVLPQKK